MDELKKAWDAFEHQVDVCGYHDNIGHELRMNKTLHDLRTVITSLEAREAEDPKDIRAIVRLIRQERFADNGASMGYAIDYKEAAAEIDRYVQARLAAAKTVPMAMLRDIQRGVYYSDAEANKIAARYGYAVTP